MLLEVVLANVWRKWCGSYEIRVCTLARLVVVTGWKSDAPSYRRRMDYARSANDAHAGDDVEGMPILSGLAKNKRLDLLKLPEWIVTQINAIGWDRMKVPGDFVEHLRLVASGKWEEKSQIKIAGSCFDASKGVVVRKVLLLMRWTGLSRQRTIGSWKSEHQKSMLMTSGENGHMLKVGFGRVAGRRRTFREEKIWDPIGEGFDRQWGWRGIARCSAFSVITET